MAKTTIANPLLGELSFEKKNKPQPRLPPNTIIQRRPLNHPPVASPYAGPSVQKVVYVSRATPLMAAVKRVKKLLSHIEKRAMQGVDMTKGKDGLKPLTTANEALSESGEEVVVRASGRAIEQALKVGEWFKCKEEELTCRLEVRTGSVQVVDDLVVVEGEEGPDGEEEVADAAEVRNESMDRGLAEISSDAESAIAQKKALEEKNPEQKMEKKAKKRRRRGKRKQAVYEKDDMPEARIRWINTVEVAISLKG